MAKIVKDDLLENVTGGRISTSQQKCIFCGGDMVTIRRKGKKSGGATMECSVCGATYDPTLKEPWQKGSDNQ